MVGHQSLPRAFPHARRGSEARRLAGGRLSGRTAGALAVREFRQADDHALPQPLGARGRGAPALASGRRRRAPGRVRQDHAGHADGRDQHEPADALPARRPDAPRQLPGPRARFRERRLEILGGQAGRSRLRGRMAGDGERHRAELWHLHGDGHGFDDDGARRDPRPDASRRVLHPGRRFRPCPHGDGLRSPDRRDDPRGPEAQRPPHARLLRECARRAHGARRLDQCDHPSDRDGRPRRDRALARRFRPRRARRSGHRQSPPLRRVPDGGFLLCRWTAGIPDRARGTPPSRRAHRFGEDARRGHRRRQGLQCRGDPSARQSRLQRRSARRSCAAISPPPAR